MPKQENEKVWLTADGRKIPMSQMETDHLLTAFISIADREFQKFQQVKPLLAVIDKYQEIKDNLIAEMQKRNVEPVYPDQKYNNRIYGRYFENERKTHAMKPVDKPVLSTEVSK